MSARNDGLVSWISCRHCGKKLYFSRKEARRAAHRFHPHDTGLQAYRCPVQSGWHFGHRDPYMIDMRHRLGAS